MQINANNNQNNSINCTSHTARNSSSCCNDINLELQNSSIIKKNSDTPKQSFSNSFSMQSNISGELCRICYMSERKERLIHPCKCSGTMGLIHKSCLEKWLSSSNSNECEICHHKFVVKRVARPFYQWFVRPVSTRDHKNLMGDVICFFVLTPLAVISAWLCILGAIRYHEWENKWEAIGLVVLTCFLMLIYLTWCIISLKYHIKVFKDWQSQNHIVSLNISNLSANRSRRSNSMDNSNQHNSNNLNSGITSTPNNSNNNRNNAILLNTLNTQSTALLLENQVSSNNSLTCLLNLNKKDVNIENTNECVVFNIDQQQADELMNLTHVSNDSTLPFAFV